MIKKILLFSVIIFQVFVSCSVSRPFVSNQSNIGIQYFYDELSPYGYWVHNREYGYVWIPHAGKNFLPYVTNGSWVLTNYGWTWVSDYEWGWAAFHYGRWDYDPNYGWFWFPGYEWAPAWVEWRYGDGYYGWAPMKPESKLKTITLNDELYRWIFVREEDFGRQNMNRYYLNKRKNAEIIRNTKVSYDPVYGGPDPGKIVNSTGRRINRLPVRETGIPGTKLSRNQLEIFKPEIRQVTSVERPSPQKITDIKDIRPMRDRNNSYQPDDEVTGNEIFQEGQGKRNADPEKIQNERAREVRRQFEIKQTDRQTQKQKNEQLQNQKAEENNRQKDAGKEYQQRRGERLQKTEQQRKIMEKERLSRDSVKADASRRRTRNTSSGNRQR